MVKNGKIEHHHWIPFIQIILGTNFQLKLIILIFWPDLPKKGFSGLTQKKRRPHIFYIILHIQISLVWNFRSNWQFLFIWIKFTRKSISGRKLKKLTSSFNSAYSNYSLGTKVLLYLTILIFLTRFVQKGFFLSKKRKVNTTYFLRNSAYSS